MKKLPCFLAAALIPLLLSACSTYKPMTSQEKEAFTGVVPAVVVTSVKPFLLTSGLDAAMHAMQGDSVETPVESGDEKVQARLVQALAKYGVDIQEITTRQLQDGLKKRPALQPRNPGQAPNAKLAVAVNVFGSASGMFSGYGPNLGLQAQLRNTEGRLLWTKYRYVAHSSAEMPHYKLDELLDNPVALRTVYEAAAKYTVNALLDSLEAELKMVPAAVNTPKAADSKAPVAGATPPAPAAKVPLAVQVQSTTDAFGDPVQPTCNGWCGLPSGGIRLDE